VFFFILAKFYGHAIMIVMYLLIINNLFHPTDLFRFDVGKFLGAGDNCMLLVNVIWIKYSLAF